MIEGHFASVDPARGQSDNRAARVAPDRAADPFGLRRLNG
jgi:hypothetical protein